MSEGRELVGMAEKKGVVIIIHSFKAMKPYPFVKTVNANMQKYKQLGSVMVMAPPLNVKKQSAEHIFFADDGGTPYVAKSYTKAKYADLTERVNTFFTLLGGEVTLASERNWYFLSEYYNAGSLDQYIANDVTLTESQMKNFIRQLANKLKTLHEAGFYHGQLTPSQILINIDEAGEPTFDLCGFGHYIPRDPAFYTDEANALYLDPVSVEDAVHTCDPTSDIWSLGIIAYQLATGAAPNLREWMTEGAAQGMLAYQPAYQISAPLNHLLSHCLKAKPQDRILAKDIPSHPLFIPVRTSLDPYVIGKEIASGAFARVHVGTSSQMPNTQFAIKIVNPIEKLDPNTQMLILGEITILLKMLHCPYAIKLYDYFQFEESLHLVLEFCNGGDADAFFRKKFEHPELLGWGIRDDICLTTYSLAQALQTLHNMKIIHRDIKPKNILIISDPETSEVLRVKLADFGTSREAQQPAHTIAGTPGYIAPEVLKDSGYGHKADVWSFGVTLFNLAYGTTPNGVDKSHNIYSQKSVKYPTQTSLPLPPSFLNLMKDCLSYEADSRPSFEKILTYPYFQTMEIESLPKLPSEYGAPVPITATSQWKLLRVQAPSAKQYLLKILNKSSIPIENEKRSADLHQLVLTRGCSTLLRLQRRFLVQDQLHLILRDSGSDTLHDFLRAHAPSGCDYKTGERVCIDVGSALYFLHTRKISHRRVSAHNIYVQKVAGHVGLSATLASLNDLVQISYPPKQETDPHWKTVQMMMEAVADPFKADVIAYAAIVFFVFFGKYPDLGTGLAFPATHHLTQQEFKGISGLIQRCVNIDSAYTAEVLANPLSGSSAL